MTVSVISEMYPIIRLIIEDKIFQGNKFSFTEVSQSEIEKEIKNLNVKKATKSTKIYQRKY